MAKKLRKKFISSGPMPVPKWENVLVVGAGIAGLEAASQLLSLGYKVTVIDKASYAGGHVASWHKLFPDRTDASSVITGLLSSIAGATLLLSTEILSVHRLGEGFAVVLSGGETLYFKAILLATGFSLFPAEKKEEYGYGVYNQVITNSDLEQWFNEGNDPRINDRKISSVGFVHCVGSRDIKAGNPQCSKVCCITAVKQAIEIKQHFPDAEVWCFYMDLRLFGKKYEDFYISAQKDYGIHFIRGRVSEVSEAIDGEVIVKAEDTLNGRPVKIKLSLLVLMAGIISRNDIQPLAEDLSVMMDSDGFLLSRDNITGITRSQRPGIFYAGTCTGPKTIPESLAEARSAAIDIHNYLRGL